jgi:hypothetical protein
MISIKKKIILLNYNETLNQAGFCDSQAGKEWTRIGSTNIIKDQFDPNFVHINIRNHFQG